MQWKEEYALWSAILVLDEENRPPFISRRGLWAAGDHDRLLYNTLNGYLFDTFTVGFPWVEQSAAFMPVSHTGMGQPARLHAGKDIESFSNPAHFCSELFRIDNQNSRKTARWCPAMLKFGTLKHLNPRSCSRETKNAMSLQNQSTYLTDAAAFAPVRF